MAKVDLNYRAINELADELLLMTDEMKDEIKLTAQEIANELKSNTISAMPRGAVAKHGIHLADDVKSSVSVSDKKASITVKGGSKTGGYWFIVDNGHVAENGKFVDGAHFTDKAYNATEVEKPVDALIARLLKDG